MAELAEKVQQEVTAAVANDDLQLPTLPEVALRIREVAEREDVSAQSLAAVVAEDAGLAGQMIKMANSPMFRGTRTIEDLNMALSRLGVEYAANLATGLAMRQMFQATSDVIDKRLRKTWEQAADIAAVSGVIAKSFAKLRADQATLAGLTHTIGVLPILTWAEEHDSLIRDSMTLDRVIESIHGSLGTMILQSWGFPEEIALVPSQYLDLKREATSADYADVVLVANLQRLHGTDHPLAKEDWHAVSAFQRVGLDPDMQDESLEDFTEDVTAAKAAFG